MPATYDHLGQDGQLNPKAPDPFSPPDAAPPPLQVIAPSLLRAVALPRFAAAAALGSRLLKSQLHPTLQSQPQQPPLPVAAPLPPPTGAPSSHPVVASPPDCLSSLNT